MNETSSSSKEFGGSFSIEDLLALTAKFAPPPNLPMFSVSEHYQETVPRKLSFWEKLRVNGERLCARNDLMWPWPAVKQTEPAPAGLLMKKEAFGGNRDILFMSLNTHRAIRRDGAITTLGAV